MISSLEGSYFWKVETLGCVGIQLGGSSMFFGSLLYLSFGR